MSIGICKLTGTKGHLVKSHILPAALTGPFPADMPFAQAGHNFPPIKRWDSWYDATIVTRAGEDILSSYDNYAVAELRRHRLVWSGWGSREKLESPDYLQVPDTPGYGARRIVGIDGKKMRLFFLSLLWRAAVSRMVEFAEVELHASEIRRLRRMLVAGDPTPLSRYPMRLVQLSTLGELHNLTPLAQHMPRRFDQLSKGSIPIFRFYMDGLIVHIHRKSDAQEVAEFGELLVGAGDDLLVTTVPFESSWQRVNRDELAREAAERWPGRLKKIPGFR